MAIQRVGILTGGGDCPGLNAVIRAFVRVGRRRYDWEILGIEDAFNGLVDLDYKRPKGNRWLDIADVHGIIEQGGTILGTSNKGDPFDYIVKDPDGSKRTIDTSGPVMDNFRKLRLDAIVSIGGDGSMRIAKRFMDLGMPIVGVPKTIDNDLAGTDQTFGFDTAVNVATECIDRIRDTADSHDRVMLVEVMGRHAGWIALQAGLAGGADAILVPEIPYRIAPIAEMIAARRADNHHYSIIVVAEGAKPAGGEASVGERAVGEMPRLMGAAHRVADVLEPQVEADIRVTVLGHIQRGGSPSAFDRVLGTRYGEKAAEMVAREQFGQMCALRDGDIVSCSLDEATAAPKLLTPDHRLVQTARALGVCLGEA
ncbi:MAG: ATP-dependent 6-phosphofructokinase [Myxococcota bacterium]